GTLLETPNFYHYLSAQQNLKIACAIKQTDATDIDRVLDIVNLTERRHSKFNTFSLGMKQRLAIASALLGDPSVLVFDEPTNGLDPAGIAEIRALIIQLNKQGKTIIMASHILDEVEKVCTHVAIIQKGILMTTSTVDDLMKQQQGNVANDHHQSIAIEIAADDLVVLSNVLNQNKKVLNITKLDNKLSVTVTEDTDTTALNKYCFENGIVLSMLHQKSKTLETRFLEIT